MKNNVLLLLSVIGLLTFSACMQDQPNESDVRKEVKVSASFKNSASDAKVTTRATGNTWQVGDAIGLFMKNAGSTLAQPALSENAKYITTGSSSFAAATENDKIYFPFNEKKVDFISYHPYTTSLSGLNYVIDVSNQDQLSDIDLLYSNNVNDKSSNDQAIALTFEHQLTKVVLIIGTNQTGKELTGLTAKITDVNTKASFSLVDGSISAASMPAEVSFNVNAEGTLAEAIVLPIDDLSNEKIVITIDGTNYTYQLSSSEVKSFEKSKEYEYTVTIEKGQGPILNGVAATIKNWTTVKENIIITEDPAVGTTEGDSTINGGGTPIIPPVVVDPPVTYKGDGTEANPYTINQALQKVSVESNVWIKGYIVGYYSSFTSKNTFVNNAEKATPYLALAASPDETDYEKTFPVKMYQAPMAISDAVSLASNSDNLKKGVTFYGSIGEYNPAFKIIGKEIQKSLHQISGQCILTLDLKVILRF